MEKLGIEGRLDFQGLHIHGDLIPNGETVTVGDTAFAFRAPIVQAMTILAAKGNCWSWILSAADKRHFSGSVRGVITRGR